MALLAVQEMTEEQSTTSEYNDPSNEATHDQNPDLSNDPFSKRYGDLRRHHEQVKKELNERIAALEEKTKGATSPLPSSPDEIEAFKRKYPEVYKVIQTEALRTAASSNGTFKTVSDKVEKLEKENYKMQEILKLHQKYPGFETTLNDTAFRSWLKKQDESVRELANSDSADDWGVLFDSYKRNRKTKSLPTSEQTLQNSSEPDIRASGDTVSRKKVWTLQEIQNLTPEQYAHHEASIMDFFKGMSSK